MKPKWYACAENIPWMGPFELHDAMELISGFDEQPVRGATMTYSESKPTWTPSFLVKQLGGSDDDT